MSKDYLIWSLEHKAWWMPNSCGYTGEVKQAGRYTKEEADLRCDNPKKEKAIHISDLEDSMTVVTFTHVEIQSMMNLLNNGKTMQLFDMLKGKL